MGDGVVHKEALVDRFQSLVDDVLIRHHSVIDVLSKLSEAESRVQRAIAKSVTGCGCIKIEASRQTFPENASWEGIHEQALSHVSGNLCHRDRQTVEQEIGQLLFYLTALGNVLDISLYDVLVRKYNEASTLGRFYLG